MTDHYVTDGKHLLSTTQRGIAALEDGIREEVLEPFDDGLGVASSNYRRLSALLDADD